MLWTESLFSHHPFLHELLVPSIQLEAVAQLLSHQNSSLIKIQNVTSIVTSLDVVVIVRSLSLNEDSWTRNRKSEFKQTKSNGNYRMMCCTLRDIMLSWVTRGNEWITGTAVSDIQYLQRAFAMFTQRRTSLIFTLPDVDIIRTVMWFVTVTEPHCDPSQQSGKRMMTNQSLWIHTWPTFSSLVSHWRAQKTTQHSAA